MELGDDKIMSILYNYLSYKTADSTSELEVDPQDVMILTSQKESSIHEGYEPYNEEIISFSGTKKYFLNLQFSTLSETDFEYIFDFFNDPDKADGNVRSFYYTPNNQFEDTYTYVCRFNIDTLSGFLKSYKTYGYANLTLKVLGRKIDEN